MGGGKASLNPITDMAMIKIMMEVNAMVYIGYSTDPRKAAEMLS